MTTLTRTRSGARAGGSSAAGGDKTVQMLTVSEAAERLGFGERYVRRLISEKRIQYVKYGKARSSPVRIPETEVVRLITESTVQPSQ